MSYKITFVIVFGFHCLHLHQYAVLVVKITPNFNRGKSILLCQKFKIWLNYIKVLSRKSVVQLPPWLSDYLVAKIFCETVVVFLICINMKKNSYLYSRLRDGNGCAARTVEPECLMPSKQYTKFNTITKE